MSGSGAIRFARYAFPPNALHYCGPESGPALLEYADAGLADHGLDQLAARFEGAWPYLELIAHECGIGDPLDDRVVDAYWLGSNVLRRVDRSRFAQSLEDRFGGRDGWVADRVLSALPGGAVPNHSFHVFGVYPWLGLLREGSTEPLRILDRCRIRSGVVESVGDGVAQVRSRPLIWTGESLGFGLPAVERVTTSENGYSLAGQLRRGDVVSMHWDWICERITPSEARRLDAWTSSQLAVVNAQPVPAPATVLG